MKRIKTIIFGALVMTLIFSSSNVNAQSIEKSNLPELKAEVLVENVKENAIIKNLKAPRAVFTLTYDGNGATAGAPLTDPTVFDGTIEADVLIQGTLEKTGFTFEGWTTNADGTGTTYTPGESFLVTANTTLYAKWTQNAQAANEFRVTYDGNGATAGAPLTDPTVFDGTVEADVLIQGTLEKTGFTFEGWTTNADGTGTTYTPGQSFLVTANTTLYAKWTQNAQAANEFRVTYDGNGATAGAPLTDPTVFDGTVEADVLIQGTLEKTGFTFEGWTTNADGTGTTYTPGQSFLVTANTTLYAKWTQNVQAANEFRVTYDGNGATAGAPLTDPTVFDGTIEADVLIQGTLEKTGFTFAGWNTTADGTGTTYQPGNSFLVTANTTLFAQWKAVDGVTAIVNQPGKTIVTASTAASTPIVRTDDYQNPFSLLILLGMSLIVLIKIKKSLFIKL